MTEPFLLGLSIGIVVGPVLIGLVLWSLMPKGGRGKRPEQPVTGPIPCGILSWQSPLRDDGYCAGKGPRKPLVQRTPGA